jgi:cyclopropane-fatty-acyl-phospholipid synthase
MDPARTARAIFDSPTRAFEVRLWDGTPLPAARGGGPPARLVVRRPEALSAFLSRRSERRLAEAYLEEAIDFEGDVAGLLEAATQWEGPRLRANLAGAALGALLRGAEGSEPGLAARVRGRRHSEARDRDAVRHHYDVSDDFYRLLLGPGLVYSCALFPTGAESLEEAQQAKLELVCRKLALRPGNRLLDVGCGWGALLAHAAARYQVDGVGITVSERQLSAARRRLAEEAPGRDLAVLPLDYRALHPEQPFDKIASIGMMEHVGRERLAGYFAGLHHLLVPGGLLLNHAIADAAPGQGFLRWAGRRRGDGFIDRYVFPDHDLVPIGEVVRAAEQAGFEVRDLESLREHYAETLGRWLGRLEADLAEAERLVGRRRARAWRLYLAGAQVAFRLGHISVYQLLLARRGPGGRVTGLPRSRAAWYAGDPVRDAGPEAAPRA